jgi:hypothetical protein
MTSSDAAPALAGLRRANPRVGRRHLAHNRAMASRLRRWLVSGRLAYQRAYLLWVYRLRITWLAILCRRFRNWLKNLGRKISLRGAGNIPAPEIREIKAEDLLATWLGLPEFLRNDTGMATLVLKHFFGLDWINKHIDPDASRPGPLTLAGSPSELEYAKIRVVDLAESIFNLQKIKGVHECINRLRTANELEPTIAELHIGKMIFANDWPFEFVIPSPGRTYDFEIQYGEFKVCADAKCKVDQLVPTSSSISNTLKHKRKQLPKDGPGIFFVKLPQEWMEHDGWQRITVQGAIDFFAQGTGRVSSVVFYLEPIHLLSFGEQKGQHYIAQQGHYFYEVANPRRRYGKELDWKLFDNWRPTDYASWSAMPAKYVRLFEFPKGLIPLIEEAARSEQEKRGI